MIRKQILAPLTECPHCQLQREELSDELRALSTSYQLKLQNSRTALANKVKRIRKANAKKNAREGFRLVTQELDQLRQHYQQCHQSSLEQLIKLAEERSTRIYNTGLHTLIKRSAIISKALSKLLKQSFRHNILEIYVHPDDYQTCLASISIEAPELSAMLHSSECVIRGNLKCKLHSNSEISYDWQKDFEGIVS